jgi:hypothetical protein
MRADPPETGKIGMGVPQRIQAGIVYRAGSHTADNCTPRPGLDTVHPAGLSTYTTIERALERGGKKAQTIDLARLPPTLAGFMDEEGHVAIVPVDPDGKVDFCQLNEWAACRGTEKMHQFTQLVLDAIVDEERRPS